METAAENMRVATLRTSINHVEKEQQATTAATASSGTPTTGHTSTASAPGTLMTTAGLLTPLAAAPSSPLGLAPPPCCRRRGLGTTSGLLAGSLAERAATDRDRLEPSTTVNIPCAPKNNPIDTKKLVQRLCHNWLLNRRLALLPFSVGVRVRTQIQLPGQPPQIAHARRP